MTGGIEAYFRGEKPLWQAFWVFSSIGGLLVVVFSQIFLLFVPDLEDWIKATVHLFVIGSWVVVSGIILWKCSVNTRHKFWTFAARGMVVLNTVVFLGMLTLSLKEGL